MKKVKLFLWLVILIFLGLLIYQNQDYFMTKQAFNLNIDLKFKSWHWTIPEIQNIAYFGICFVIGFILAAIKGLSSKYKSNKVIKALNATIDSHAAQISSLRTELEVFINDPYIKKQADTPKELPEAEKEAVVEDDSETISNL